MEESALNQLKAVTSSVTTSKIAKKIRVFNTAVKPVPNGNALVQAVPSPNGLYGMPESEPQSPADSPVASSPITGVFDSGDEESRVSVNQSKHKKRKSPSFEERLGENEDSHGGSLKAGRSGGESGKKRAKSWSDFDDRVGLDTSETHIKEFIEKHRKLKRSTDTQLAASPNDASLLDNYFTASLGFFEAAALYELKAKTDVADTENWRRSIAMAVDLYRGLVPSSEKPSLLTYFVSRCDAAHLPLRSILGQRCLAMAYARLWRLQHKTLHSSFSALLKSASHRETIEVKTSQMTELIDVLRFGDYFDRSESAARLQPSIFHPFPSHPLELNPFDFIDFIREEHASVSQAEQSSTSSKGNSKSAHSTHSSSSSSSSYHASSSSSKNTNKRR